MAKPPCPIPLPVLAKINAIIVDLASLADAIEAEHLRRPPATAGVRDEHHPSLRESPNAQDFRDNVIPFPLRNPRR